MAHRLPFEVWSVGGDLGALPEAGLPRGWIYASPSGPVGKFCFRVQLDVEREIHREPCKVPTNPGRESVGPSPFKSPRAKLRPQIPHWFTRFTRYGPLPFFV